MKDKAAAPVILPSPNPRSAFEMLLGRTEPASAQALPDMIQMHEAMHVASRDPYKPIPLSQERLDQVAALLALPADRAEMEDALIRVRLSGDAAATPDPLSVAMRIAIQRGHASPLKKPMGPA